MTDWLIDTLAANNATCRHCGKNVPATLPAMAGHLTAWHGITCSTYAQVMEGYAPHA